VEIDPLEEREHVSAGVASTGVVQHLAGGDVHRREQVDRAVAFVVMGHRPASPRFHRQRRLSAIECLALGLLIEG